MEDQKKDAATLERSFSLLKLSGALDRVSGIVLGKHRYFNDCGTGRRPHEILLEVMAERRVPMIAEVDCCHTQDAQGQGRQRLNLAVVERRRQAPISARSVFR